MKVSGIYKITNTITNDFYIGSSNNVKRRWRNHKKPSKWKQYPNNQMYQDMQKYGLNNFVFEIIAEVEPEQLKKVEQQFIEELKPTYNNRRANTGIAWNGNKDEYGREHYHKHKEYYNQYHNQLCCYNGELLTLCALSHRFSRAGIPHPVLEAKKYLLNKDKYIKGE